MLGLINRECRLLSQSNFCKLGRFILKSFRKFFSYDDSLVKVCTDLRNRWVKAGGDKNELDKFSRDDLTKFSAMQVQEFLAQLVQQVFPSST